MKNFFYFLTLLAGISAVPVFGSAARDIGSVDISIDSQTIPVRVSSSDPALQQLALQAFSAHGRYRLVATGFKYDIVFTNTGAARVRVDVSRASGGTPVSQEMVGVASTPGQAARNALWQAADFAVERTNELGLKGFFASSRLVLIGERTGKTEVYATGDLFFGDTKQLTQDRNFAIMPRWSPDGNKIIYTGYFRGGRPDIFMINLSSLQRTEITNYEGTNQGGRFSPDGRRIAMALSGSVNSQIYVANADGGNPRPLTRDDTVKSSPVFSPDGTRILFVASPGPKLFVMPAGGGTAQELKTNFNNNTEPDWSRANPNKLVFTAQVGGRSQIAVYDFSTGASKQVSNAPYDAMEPSWLPDGRHVVCTFRTRSESYLVVLDTETGAAKRISPVDLGPAKQASVWSP